MNEEVRVRIYCTEFIFSLEYLSSFKNLKALPNQRINFTFVVQNGGLFNGFLFHFSTRSRII